MTSSFIAYLKANIQRDLDCLKDLAALPETDYAQCVKLIQRITVPSTPPTTTETPKATSWQKPSVSIEAPKPLRETAASQPNVASPLDGKKATPSAVSSPEPKHGTDEGKTALSTDALPQRTSPILKHLHHVASPSLRRQQSSSAASLTTPSPSAEKTASPPSRPTSAFDTKSPSQPASPSTPSAEKPDVAKVASKFGAISFKSPPTHTTAPEKPAIAVHTDPTPVGKDSDAHPTTPSRATKPSTISEMGQRSTPQPQDGPRDEVAKEQKPYSPASPPSALANLIQRAHQQAQETQHVIPKPAPSHSPFTGGPIVPKRKSTSQHATVQIPQGIRR